MMPTSNSHDVTDPIQQRLRHLGDHLDAERRAQTGPTAEVDPEIVPGTRSWSSDPSSPAIAGASDGESRSVYRWLAVAAAVVVSVAAGAVMISNWRSTAVQSASVTEPSTVPIASTTVPASTGPVSSTVQPDSTVAPASTVPATAGDTAWAFWPDGAETQGGASSPVSFGEIASIAAGPRGAVFVAKSLNAEDQVEIWTTTDGVRNEPVTTDGLVGLSAATVFATADAYYVAPVSPSDEPVVLWRSTDLQNWAQLDDSFIGRLLPYVGGGPALIREVPVGLFGTRLEWSPDGVTWRPVDEDGTGDGLPEVFTITSLRYVGGEHGYLATYHKGDRFGNPDQSGWAESVDGHRWRQLPAPPIFGAEASIDGGMLMVGADYGDCSEPCAQRAFRFDNQNREWTEVAAPPLRGWSELRRVGDTLVVSGTVSSDERPRVAVYVSPVDQIAWTPVEIGGQQVPISTELTDETGTVHDVDPVSGPVLGVGNRVIIPVRGPAGQFVVGAVADGGVANYGLESLPACETASGPVVRDCVYTVVPGDFPESIADRFGTNMDRLIDANADVPVSELTMMFPGSRIIIPAPGG